jgi:hypothetical protein
MKTTLMILTLTFCAACASNLRAQSNTDSYIYKYKSRLVGEISLVNIKAEFSKVQIVNGSFLGLTEYYRNLGIGAYLIRYNNVLEGHSDYIEKYGIIEWLPFRISYVPFFIKGYYYYKNQTPEDASLFIWNPVTRGEYAKFYVRLFGEASLLKTLSRWEDARHYAPNTPISRTQFRKIGKLYPPTLTIGVQLGFTLLSLEGGYTYQTKKWYEFVKHGYYVDPGGFTFTDFYFSAAFNIGAIFTRSTINKSEY